MDQQIKIRNAKTGQECTFDTIEAADNFGNNIADRADWDLAGSGADTTAPLATVTDPKTGAVFDIDTVAAPVLTDVVETAPEAAPAVNDQPAA